MNIGILGGSFNPIHRGHIKIAEIASRRFYLKKIFFVVSKIPPHKSLNNKIDENKSSFSFSQFLLNAFHRLNMVKLAIRNRKNFFVSDFEIKRKGISYTYYTIKYFTKKFPDDKLFFIIGKDELNILDKWYKIDKIFTMVDFIVVNRKTILNPPIKFLSNYREKIHFLKIKPINISSTYIREYIWRKKHIWTSLPSAVSNYIKKNLLYL